MAVNIDIRIAVKDMGHTTGVVVMAMAKNQGLGLGQNDIHFA